MWDKIASGGFVSFWGVRAYLVLTCFSEGFVETFMSKSALWFVCPWGATPVYLDARFVTLLRDGASRSSLERLVASASSVTVRRCFRAVKQGFRGDTALRLSKITTPAR